MSIRTKAKTFCRRFFFWYTPTRKAITPGSPADNKIVEDIEMAKKKQTKAANKVVQICKEQGKADRVTVAIRPSVQTRPYQEPPSQPTR